MNKCNGIPELAEQLENLKQINVTDSNVVFELTSHDASCDDIGSRVYELLQNIGYTNQTRRTLRGDKLHIDLKATQWNGECPIFINWAELFATVVRKSKIPEHFLIISDLTASSNVSHINVKRMKLYIKLLNVLSQLSDHCEPKSGLTQGSQRLLFLVESESSSHKKDFKPFIEWNDLIQIGDVESSLKSITKLGNALNVGDSQDEERKSVMRSALMELIIGCQTQMDIFPFLMRSIEEFLSKYEEHHELFIKRFSVNKALQEINKQDLEYTSKINEIISSGQTKALTIPGALVAIGAIMKIDHVHDAIAVALGLLATTLIILKAIKVHNETFAHLKKQINAEFARYDSIAEKFEVRKQANKVKDALQNLVESAILSLSFIKKCLWATFAVSLLYLVMSVTAIDNKQKEPSKSQEVVTPK